MTRARCVVFAAAVLFLVAPVSAHAVSVLIPGEDGGGLTAEVSASFGFNPACVSTSCQLTVELSYDSIDGSLTKSGQVLTGVIFEPIFSPASTSQDVFAGGSGSILLGGGTAELSVGSLFVGPDAAQAVLDLGTDVSPQWAVNANLAFGIANDLGSILITSVGDITYQGATVSGAGTTHLLSSTGQSSVETNPPNGVDFGLVPLGVCDVTSCPLPLGNDPDDAKRALVADSITFVLNYDGSVAQLVGIEPVDGDNFLFGTDGNVVPEPATASLLALGLLALSAHSRRRSR